MSNILLVVLYWVITAAWAVIMKFTAKTLTWQTNMTLVWASAFICNSIFVFRFATIPKTWISLLAICGGILASMGTIIFYRLASKVQLSMYLPMTNLYMVFSTIGALIFFKERITPLNGVGIILAIAASILLSLR
jgi:transporter family protein